MSMVAAVEKRTAVTEPEFQRGKQLTLAEAIARAKR